MNGVPTRGNLLSMDMVSILSAIKKNFVDRETGAHTQHIERAWQNYKLEVWRHRGNRTPESLKLHLKMIEWHHWLGVRHYNGVLGRLFHDLKKQVK